MQNPKETQDNYGFVKHNLVAYGGVSKVTKIDFLNFSVIKVCLQAVDEEFEFVAYEYSYTPSIINFGIQVDCEDEDEEFIEYEYSYTPPLRNFKNFIEWLQADIAYDSSSSVDSNILDCFSLSNEDEALDMYSKYEYEFVELHESSLYSIIDRLKACTLDINDDTKEHLKSIIDEYPEFLKDLNIYL